MPQSRQESLQVDSLPDHLEAFVMAVFAMAVGGAAALSACVILLHLLLKYLQFRKYELAIPGPPSRFVLGNLLDAVSITPDTVFAFMMKMWGGRTELTRFSYLNKLFVFVSDPDDLALALRRKEFANKARFFYQFIECDFPKNIVTLNGAEWKRHRTAAQPGFHNEVLDSFEDVFVQETENFVKRIVPNQEQDPEDNLTRMLSRSFVRTAVSSEADNEAILNEAVPFVSAFFRALNERAFKPWLWMDWIFKRTATHKILQTGLAKFRAFGTEFIKDRKRQLAAEATPAEHDFIKRKKTLLYAIIDAQMESKDIPIEDEHIVNEVLVFFAAAMDTSTSTLSSAFKCLSFYPDVQERLYAEVKQVLGDAKRSVTLDDVAKMTYLDAFLKETLRVLPAIPFVARQVYEKTEFAGKVLPAGTTMLLNLYGVHRDPRHWKEPLRFNPHRFLSGQERHPYAYIPFSAGPRNCIGQRYAMQFAKVVLATTLRDYRVDRANDGLTDHNQLNLTFSLTFSVVGGARVTFTQRAP